MFICVIRHACICMYISKYRGAVLNKEVGDARLYETSIETALMDHIIQKSKGKPSPPYYAPEYVCA